MVGWGVSVGTDTVVAAAAGSKLVIDTTTAEYSCSAPYPRVIHPLDSPFDDAAAAWVRGANAVVEYIDPENERRRRQSSAALGGEQNLLCGEDVVIRDITYICKRPTVQFFPLPCWDGKGLAKTSKLSLETLWHRVRALDCCGAGFYGRDAFMHVDVGRPRFWEKTTSRVGENLAGGNARLFARTEYDRYATGERVVVSVHSLTLPPVRIAHEAKLGATPVRLDGDGDCIELTRTGATLELPAAPATPERARLTLTTCEPRAERTPATIETNPITVGN